MTISSDQGLVIALGQSAELNDARLAVAATPGQLGVYLLQDQRKLEICLPPWEAAVTYGLVVMENVNKPFRHKLEFTLRPFREAHSPAQVSFSLSPAACIALAHESSTRWAGNVLITRSQSNEQWRVDGRSGALMEYRKTWTSGASQGEFQLSFRNGAFARHRDAIVKRSANNPNQFDSQCPVSSFATFLLHPTVIRQLENWQRTAGAPTERDARSGDSKGCCGPRPTVSLRPAFRPREPQPGIPHPRGRRRGQRRTLDAPLAVGSLPYMGVFFPNESWPWALWKATVMGIVGDTSQIRQAIWELHESEDNGPLCYAFASMLAEKASSDAARLLAEMGLKRLSLEHFQNDCHRLFDKSALCGRGLHVVAAFLANWTKRRRNDWSNTSLSNIVSTLRPLLAS